MEVTMSLKFHGFVVSVSRNRPKGDAHRVAWRFRRFGTHRLWVIHIPVGVLLVGHSRFV